MANWILQLAMSVQEKTVEDKEMHFSFDGRIYQQTDGSPLEPVIANVFMVHLEETPKVINSEDDTRKS